MTRSSADAVARETAWLSTAGDGLPALLKTSGGPFDDVHAYLPTDMPEYERTLYVLRGHITQDRFAAQRVMNTYQMRLIAWWPLTGGDGYTGSAEDEQAALDAAVELVFQRILGPPPVGGQLLDKTHGGRFLSVAENPRRLDADFTDPTVTIPEGYVRADITYSIDDFEFPG